MIDRQHGPLYLPHRSIRSRSAPSAGNDRGGRCRQRAILPLAAWLAAAVYETGRRRAEQRVGSAPLRGQSAAPPLAARIADAVTIADGVNCQSAADKSRPYLPPLVGATPRPAARNRVVARYLWAMLPVRIAQARGPTLCEAAAAPEQARNDPQWTSSAQPAAAIEFAQRIAWQVGGEARVWGAIRRDFLQIATHAGQKSPIDGFTRRRPSFPKAHWISYISPV